MVTIIKYQLLLLAKISKFDKNVKTKEISIEYKYHAIKRFEIKEATHDQIAQDLDVARCSITKWCGVQKKAIIEAYESSFCS